MSPQRILISGASLAGPAAAYWLDRAGHEVTVVERFPQLRGAGQNVDVRGPGRDVLERMGLLNAVREATTGEVGLRFVDDDGAAIGEFPMTAGGNDGPTAELEVLRGELSRILVDAGGPGIEYVFADSIAAMDQDASGVDVTFATGAQRRFDAVVIAEGARSRSRRLAFGDVPTRDLGLYIAYCTLPRVADDDQWWRWYNATGGRTITIRPDNLGTMRAGLSFLSPPRGLEDLDAAGQRVALREAYRDVGWAALRVLDALDAADEIYVDYLNQVLAPRWSTGRIALLGDAAWCITPLGGYGTTLALTGAYVLAGELASAATVEDAFRAYEGRMRPPVSRAQNLPPGTPRLAHPKSALGVKALRTAVRIAASGPAKRLGGLFTGSASDPFVLPDYALSLGGGTRLEQAGNGGDHKDAANDRQRYPR